MRSPCTHKPLLSSWILFAALWSMSVPCRASVGVFPVQVTGYVDSASVVDGLDANLRVVLGEKLRIALWKPGCVERPKCLADIAREFPDVEELALLAVARESPSSAWLTVRVFDLSGQETLAVEQLIKHEESAADVEALLRRVFHPRGYRGTLKVVGAPADAQLFADGLVLEEQEVPLRVGQHVLELRQPGQAPVSIPFSIAFEKTTRVDAGAPIEPPASTRSSWPGTVAAGAALVGAITATTCAIVLGAVLPERPERKSWRSIAVGEAELAASDDPKGAGFQDGYGSTPDEQSTARGLVSVAVGANRVREASTEDSILVASIIGGSVLTVTAGTAALVSLLGGVE